MAYELYLHYADLAATTKKFTSLGESLFDEALVWGPKTGTVDITSALNAIQVNAVDLSTNLKHVATACTEVAKEVQVVDQNGALTLKPVLVQVYDQTGYVHHAPPTGPYVPPALAGDEPTLDVPGVRPYGPYAGPAKPPEDRP